MCLLLSTSRLFYQNLLWKPNFFPRFPCLVSSMVVLDCLFEVMGQACNGNLILRIPQMLLRVGLVKETCFLHGCFWGAPVHLQLQLLHFPHLQSASESLWQHDPETLTASPLEALLVWPARLRRSLDCSPWLKDILVNTQSNNIKTSPYRSKPKLTTSKPT